MRSPLCIFTRRKVALDDCSLNVNETAIRPSGSAKFLGVTLDCKLNWKEHLKNLRTKCIQRTNIMRALAACYWGAHPQTLLLFYKAIIRGVIDYASVVILPKSNEFYDRLEIPQRAALRVALGLRNSSPNRLVYAEACEAPIRFRVDNLAMKFILRCTSLINHPVMESITALKASKNSRSFASHPLIKAQGKLSHQISIISCSSQLPCYEAELGALLHTPDTHKFWGSKLNPDLGPEVVKKLFTQKREEDFPGRSIFFTDGSKMEGKEFVGLAIYSSQLDLEGQFKINSAASVFTSEALAIKICLEFIKAGNIREAVIFTDSQSTLEALHTVGELVKSRNYLIVKIKELLYVCMSSSSRAGLSPWRG